jgi:dUTPase
VPAHSFVVHRHQNWLQVANMSNESITIHHGKAIAAFHRQDAEVYEFRDVSLDEMHNESRRSAAAV